MIVVVALPRLGEIDRNPQESIVCWLKKSVGDFVFQKSTQTALAYVSYPSMSVELVLWVLHWYTTYHTQQVEI